MISTNPKSSADYVFEQVILKENGHTMSPNETPNVSDHLSPQPMDDMDDEEDEQPLVIDIASIIQQGEKVQELLEQDKDCPNKAELQFQCSTCPKQFSSKIQRTMHEKLHMQNRGHLSDTSLKSKLMTSKQLAGQVASASAAGSKNDSSLLCSVCHVYFRTSTAKQEHICTENNTTDGTKKHSLLKRFCITCGKEFLCEFPKLKCLGCLRSKKRKFEGREASEEIREINGQRVKVIKINNMEQLSRLNESGDQLKPFTSAKKKKKKVDSQPNLKTVMKTSKKMLKKKKLKAAKHTSPSPLEELQKVTESGPIAVFDEPDRGPKITFTCLYCQAVFYFPDTLKHHSISQHGNFYYCHFCFMMFLNPTQQKVHDIECPKIKINPKQLNSQEYIFDFTERTCKDCKVAFNNDNDLLNHAISKHLEQFCEKFPEKKKLGGGENLSKNPQTSSVSDIIDSSYYCCGEYFSARAGLVQHKKQTHKAQYEVTESAVLDNLVNINRFELLTNAMNSMKIKTFKCPHCPLITFTERAEQEHLKSEHNVPTL